MKQVKFSVSPRHKTTIKGTIRSIFFDKLDFLHLLIKDKSKNGNIEYVYGEKTSTKLTLVFPSYYSGEFQLRGRAEGHIELIEASDVDMFDEKLHQSIIEVD